MISPSISGLQCLMTIGGDYVAEHEIALNCRKTIYVLFCPKKHTTCSTKYFLNSAHVPFFDQLKCLDACINASLKVDDDNDIQRQVIPLYYAAKTSSEAFSLSALLQ